MAPASPTLGTLPKRQAATILFRSRLRTPRVTSVAKASKSPSKILSTPLHRAGRARCSRNGPLGPFLLFDVGVSSPRGGYGSGKQSDLAATQSGPGPVTPIPLPARVACGRSPICELIVVTQFALSAIFTISPNVLQKIITYQCVKLWHVSCLTEASHHRSAF